jgi:hypothetical protein
MNHLPYIAASYGIFVAAVLFAAVEAALRLRTTTKRLKLLDNKRVST